MASDYPYYAFSQIQCAFIYFVEDKTTPIYQVSDIHDWTTETYSRLCAKEMLQMEMTYDGLNQIVIVLQVGPSEECLLDTQNYVLLLK